MWLLRLRSVLTVVTNILMKGRELGLWTKKSTIIPLIGPTEKKK